MEKTLLWQKKKILSEGKLIVLIFANSLAVRFTEETTLGYTKEVERLASELSSLSEMRWHGMQRSAGAMESQHGFAQASRAEKVRERQENNKLLYIHIYLTWGKL